MRCSHLDAVGGLCVGERPVRQAPAARLALAVRGGGRAGRQGDRTQEAGAVVLPETQRGAEGSLKSTHRPRKKERLKQDGGPLTEYWQQRPRKRAGCFVIGWHWREWNLACCPQLPHCNLKNNEGGYSNPRHVQGNNAAFKVRKMK